MIDIVASGRQAHLHAEEYKMGIRVVNKDCKVLMVTFITSQDDVLPVAEASSISASQLIDLPFWEEAHPEIILS